MFDEDAEAYGNTHDEGMWLLSGEKFIFHTEGSAAGGDVSTAAVGCVAGAAAAAVVAVVASCALTS